VDNSAGNAGRLAPTGVLGILLAPSFGHWCSHEILSRGLGLRVGGLAASLVGLLAVASYDASGGSSSRESDAIAAVLLVGGAGLYVVGTIDEIATAHGGARHYNHRIQGLAIAPLARRDSAGLAITGQF